MRRNRIAPVVLCVGLSVFGAFGPRIAHAETTNANDAAAAEDLFRQGRAKMNEGKFAEACPLLAASNRLDSGIGTMLYLADCYEKSQKTASAWATFKEAANFAKKQGDAREKVASDRAAALEPKLTRLKIDVPAASQERELKVTRDGTEISQALWGAELPIDPGDHDIEASAPGKKPWRTKVTIGATAGQPATKLEIPPLVAMPSQAAAPTPQHVADTTDPNVGSTQRTVGIIVGGVGLVGIGVGTYFGVTAKSKADDAGQYCTNGNVCTQPGVDDRSKARDQANISTVAFIAGGTMLAGGALIYFLAPKGKKQTALANAAADGFRIRF